MSFNDASTMKKEKTGKTHEKTQLATTTRHSAQKEPWRKRFPRAQAPREQCGKKSIRVSQLLSTAGNSSWCLIFVMWIINSRVETHNCRKMSWQTNQNCQSPRHALCILAEAKAQGTGHPARDAATQKSGHPWDKHFAAILRLWDRQGLTRRNIQSDGWWSDDGVYHGKQTNIKSANIELLAESNQGMQTMPSYRSTHCHVSAWVQRFASSVTYLEIQVASVAERGTVQSVPILQAWYILVLFRLVFAWESLQRQWIIRWESLQGANATQFQPVFQDLTGKVCMYSVPLLFCWSLCSCCGWCCDYDNDVVCNRRPLVSWWSLLRFDGPRGVCESSMLRWRSQRCPVRWRRPWRRWQLRCTKAAHAAAVARLRAGCGGAKRGQGHAG